MSGYLYDLNSVFFEYSKINYQQPQPSGYPPVTNINHAAGFGNASSVSASAMPVFDDLHTGREYQLPNNQLARPVNSNSFAGGPGTSGNKGNVRQLFLFIL